MNNMVKGIILALVLFFISLILISLYYSNWGNPIERIADSYRNKRIVFDAVMACIPNTLLFFFLVNQNKLNLARGVQLVLICVLVFLLIVKFLL